MLSLIAILLILSTVSLEAHAGDGGFSALASALGSSKPSGSCSDLMESLLDSGRGAGCDCQCGCKSDSEIDCGCGCCGCQNQGTGCGCGCDCGEQMLHGCEPRPPRECQPFPVIAISQASSITPACFSKASAETRKLVAYVEKLAHEARCTKVCKALDGLMNYAQIYSMLFGRNVNKFSTGRTSCSRPVLRINEAILSSISSMARVAKSLDYQMTVAGNMKCDQASQVITKTVQNYVQLLGVLMSHVTNYLCSTSRIVSNDQILMSVDNIALIFLQLAPSTAEFLKSPSRCSECAYHQSIGAFRKHLEYMSIVARELEGSRSKSLKTALALTEHFLMVMTYEVKLNTSDNHKGYRRMQPHNLDYTHEVATVFKTKDEMLRGIMDRFDSQSGAMTDKEIYREKFTQTILADIQLFEATTKVMSMGDSAQKLAADLHVLTQAAIVEMNTAMSSSTSLSEDEFRLHTDIAQTATEYAVRVLGLIRYAKVEDIQRESGMKYLHDALTTSGATPKHRLLARLAMAKMLKAVVETPSCSGKCMPNDHFAQHKSLMGAMSEAAEKLALSYLNPSETYLPSLNQLTEEFVRDIKFLWDTLYNKRAGLCVNHNCFVIKYGIQVFENAQVLFSKYLTQNRVINQHPVEKVKKLLSSERELLSILTTIPHPLKSEDKKAISSIQQTFQRMLQCPTVGAATAKVRLSTTLAKLSSANTECHTALSNVLRNMELIVNDIISPLCGDVYGKSVPWSSVYQNLQRENRMKFVNMLPPTALFIYLLITTADASSLDGGFGDLAQAMDGGRLADSCSGLMNTLFGFTSGEQCGNECGCGCSSHIVHNNRPNCGCGCQNNGGDGRCQRCGLHSIMMEPLPQTCPAFPIASISQTNVITPMCFAKAAYETRKLVTYMENLSHGARFTKICKGLENLMNYAQIYAMLFNRNVNKFAGGKACCARPVLRINEAILSSLSNIARVAQTLDYNMRMTDTCSNCNEASTLVTKIAQTYIRLLGVVMSKVSRHMCIATRITADDPVMRYADEIAVMFLQLAPATADFLKSPCICSEPAYHKSISSFKEQLDNMARITNELDASRTTTLPSALSLVEHHLIGMTYETKLNTTDNQGGYRRMNVDNMDYAHEVATIFRKKDDMFRSVMDRFDFQSSNVSDKEMYRDKFVKTVISDVQLFEGTTSMMTKGDCTRKLTVDLQIMTEAAVSFVNKEFIKADKVPQDNFKKLIDVAQTATDYALNVIGLLQYDNAEDVTNDAGIKYLHQVLIAQGGIQNLKQQVSLSRVLKAVVETPSCSGMCMPAGHFANFRPLMRAMTGAGQKLSEVYGRGGAEVSLNAITDELIRVVKMTWDILYRKRVRSGANHECFVMQYSKQFFETAQVLFSNFLDSNRASDSQKVAKVKELISVERELLNTMTGVPHSLIAEDTQALEGMQQAFQRMLYNSELYGDSTKLKLSAIQSKVSSINSECHMALSAVVTHMLEIANILKPSS